MKNIIIYILSELLFRANRQRKDKNFYKVKSWILARFGTLVDRQVQVIEGRHCYSCAGTGIYVGYNFSDICYNCYNGWYKRPQWNVLKCIKLGRYTFHQPEIRCYAPVQGFEIINGYIEHTPVSGGGASRALLMLIFDRHYIGREYKAAGEVWYSFWYTKPYYFVNNLIHIIKYGRKSVPAYKLIDMASKVFKSADRQLASSLGGNVHIEDDLPF